ncbi:FtsX-like permease family protein [Dactylosporangium sp. AC04546]|uniref:ABC transporter permease n=1 Tax=Dactylosporangium sp. AC04546 TaxID=2862460 RepID=UPI001EDE834B|nr:FtsX-like permease family protein [Dactylosporangium sp. AC04546]WVK82511.1 FtsX-like permease family protein [Dactylosporangium sp. AC04546]
MKRLVIALTTLLAVTASVLAAGLLVEARGPFDRTFARLHGAHLAAEFDAGEATADQVAATARVAGVTAAAGPFPTVGVRPRTVAAQVPGEHGPAVPPGIELPPVTVVGRADPGGDVDRLELTAGRWATGPGEVVWLAGAVPFEIGEQFAAGGTTLTTVGFARSAGQTAQAWATPATVAAISGPRGFQMLYRLTSAGTDAEVNAVREAVAATVPPEALTGGASYLTVKRVAERMAALFLPFVVAFGVLGLVMSVLVIGIVVSGAVGSETRRIGILKALGHTPAQVARRYLAQALVPAAIGAAVGVLLGNLAAVPVLTDEFSGGATLPPWISVAVPLGALAVVAATALAPALRAARLRTVEALAVGRTPAVGRGRTARRLIGRLPLPRPVTLGLANPFTRPGRSVTIAAAVALGALGVTFGVGLALSVGGVQAALNRRDAGDVIVRAERPGGPAPSVAAVRAQPGTARLFTTTRLELPVAGLAGLVQTVAFDGDASWATYEILDGRWFAGPGEAVVPTGFLTATGLRVGDDVVVGGTTRLRIVGEVLDLRSDGVRLITDARSLAGLEQFDGFSEIHVDLVAGTAPQAWADTFNAGHSDLHAEVNTGEISGTVVALDTMAGTLTLLLVAVAGLGVLNTVVLDTRERVHELGVCKALGMAPRQTVALVLTSVAGIGLVAGLAGVPAGIALHGAVMPAMGRAAGTHLPASVLDVYGPGLVAALATGGLLIAVAGALLPAGWAARTTTARALRTE